MTRPPRSHAPETGPSASGRKPRAIRLDGENVIFRDAEADEAALPSRSTRIIPEPDESVEAPAPVAAPKRSAPWGRLFAAAVGGLFALAAGMAVDTLIRDLFARTDWLGWTGIALAGLAGVAVLAILLREVAGLARLRTIDRIRTRLTEAAEADDQRAARSALGELIALYEARPETAQGRAAMRGHFREVIDGRDLVILAERSLLAPLDAEARRIVADAAKRVSVVTAVSPRAIVDLVYVGVEAFRTIRRLSDLYGGRPGFLGFLKLARKVLGHLAVTGGMAAGDSLVQQVLGHGLAARLSARLGEGVINGLLTARVGAAAIDLCRPAPFIGTRPPRVTDFMGELTKGLPGQG